ncbi:MAG TPA: hypothetical protein VE326_11600 [Candidatus Binatia bacterium]|nr:hypothetical protein [Candidatus Binatia bacterium]
MARRWEEVRAEAGLDEQAIAAHRTRLDRVPTEHPVFDVLAKPWAGGWELHIDGIGVTQSHSLTDAEAMARDYIATDLDIDANSFDVEIRPVQ